MIKTSSVDMGRRVRYACVHTHMCIHAHTQNKEGRGLIVITNNEIEQL